MKTSMYMSRSVTNHPVFAFFDVDDTLIRVKSMLSFQAYWYEQHKDPEGFERYRLDIEQHLTERASWEALNRRYYQYFTGRQVSDVEASGRAWLHKMQTELPDFYHTGPLAVLREHQAQGREVVFVSGSFPALLDPIAEQLGVGTVLSTRMEAVGGVYTGQILPPQTIGAGKAKAIEAFLRQRGGSALDCFAYGDDISDLPMLEVVGNPCVVSGGRGLEKCARERGWPVLNP